MKCYNHTEIDAVAQCRVCKKYLCKSCYDNSKDGICSVCSRKDELANAAYIRASRERSIKECQQEYRTYIKNIIIAVCIGIAISILILLSIPSDDYIIAVGAILVIISSYLSVSVYSGYIIVNKKMPDAPDGLFLQLNFLIGLIYNIIKLPIAIVIGIFYAIPLFMKRKQKYIETVNQD